MNEYDLLMIFRGARGLRKIAAESESPADREQWDAAADDLLLTWRKACDEHLSLRHALFGAPKRKQKGKRK